ncbi:hypothetical protein NPX13_g3801 [Xylaria arbuscula]|uniref:Uncharacterized protein n=1 Tax=Xylaria arbuscula TaxID=114810 RepID=A0A9W8NI18_9PEZI|nr:hypothetical protein NPX13_g3801 [Xylaria arbuscula]
MPTRSVVEGMEKLLNSIGILLEIRKLSDKIDAEIRVEQAKSADRKKSTSIAASGSEPANASSEGSAESASAKPGETTNTTNGDNAGSSSTDKPDGSEDDPASKSSSDEAANGAAETKLANGDGAEKSADQTTAENGEDKNLRPQSSSGHKRSASVLSGASDKSSKRLKK